MKANSNTQNGVAELATKEQEFNDGKTEYETNLAEFERQKLQAQSDIKKARERIEEMGATRHVLDRNSLFFIATMNLVQIVWMAFHPSSLCSSFSLLPLFV